MRATLDEADEAVVLASRKLQPDLQVMRQWLEFWSVKDEAERSRCIEKAKPQSSPPSPSMPPPGPPSSVR